MVNKQQIITQYLYRKLSDLKMNDETWSGDDDKLLSKYKQHRASTITDPAHTLLSTPVECDCGESIPVQVHDVLAYDSIECPNCGTDIYYDDHQYNEAHNIISRG